MKKILFLLIYLLFVSCATLNKANYTSKIPQRQPIDMLGSEFIIKAKTLDVDQRDELILQEICAGNFPAFMRRLVTVQTTAIIDGKLVKAKYFVMPDYLMVGNDNDFVRVPMQPKTAQKIANKFGFFLSTPKICDDVYKVAKVKLEPAPLTIARDSFPTFVEHHEIIEQQRQNRTGLIAGIKKDVVITSAISRDHRSNRVALYGWHKLDGKAIQPVYTGHVDWYVDYSHGIRLVAQTVIVDGKSMNYKDILNDKKLSVLLCNDEKDCSFCEYPY